jgi:hypothetical protein
MCKTGTENGRTVQGDLQFMQNCGGCAEVGGGFWVKINEERSEREYRIACPSVVWDVNVKLSE